MIDWDHIFRLRCLAKQGRPLLPAEQATIEAAWKDNRSRYAAMDTEVFNATVPFGSTARQPKPVTIYVDALQTHSPAAYHGKDAAQAARVGTRHGHQWCHLFADEADCPELHAFAARIGMMRAWFQKDHYDLTPTRRARAVALGAVEVDRRQAVTVWRAQRQRRQVPRPE